MFWKTNERLNGYPIFRHLTKKGVLMFHLNASWYICRDRFEADFGVTGDYEQISHNLDPTKPSCNTGHQHWLVDMKASEDLHGTGIDDDGHGAEFRDAPWLKCVAFPSLGAIMSRETEHGSRALRTRPLIPSFPETRVAGTRFW